MAVLIDFGKLVLGVEKEVDCEALFRFAGEHGRVAAANAYADWGADDVAAWRRKARSPCASAATVRDQHRWCSLPFMGDHLHNSLCFGAGSGSGDQYAAEG